MITRHSPNNIGCRIRNTFQAVFEKITDYSTMQKVSKTLDREDNSNDLDSRWFTRLYYEYQRYHVF